MIFEPLSISLVIENMAIPNRPMHLDDLLAAAAVKEYTHGIQEDLAVIDYDSITHHLPVEKHHQGEDWVYKASIVMFESLIGKFMRPVTRRIDVVNYAIEHNKGTLKSGVKKVNTMSGALKTSVDFIPSCAYTKAIAYCVGNQDAVTKLLSRLRYIGKKHNRGQGKLLNFIVQPCAQDNAWVYRHLPVSMSDLATNDHSLVYNIGIKPPYWLNQHSAGFGLANKPIIQSL